MQPLASRPNSELPMSPNASQPGEKPASSRTRAPWGSLVLAGLIALGFWIWLSPVYSFHPTCTYTVNASVTADVEVGGEKLTATVVHQNSRSRRWISTMNSAGCKQRFGNALTYKLKDDRVLILPARLCQRGETAFPKSGELDVLRVCSGQRQGPDMAFMVDSATRPGRWKVIRNGIDFRITRMTATSTWSNPTDDIDSIAPILLRASFKYGQNAWHRSPEPFIDFHRRYNRNRPLDGFDFQVREASF